MVCGSERGRVWCASERGRVWCVVVRGGGCGVEC